MNRRTFLRRAGVASLAALAGCFDDDSPPTTRTTAPPTTRSTTAGTPTTTEGPTETHTATTTDDASLAYADRFGTVTNLADVGAALDASESINALLDDVAGDDTLVYLPAGEYLLDDVWEFPSFTNFGIVGDGAVIRPPDGYSDHLIAVGGTGRASGLLVDGVTFDFRAPNTGGRPIQAAVDDGLQVRNVTVRGTADVKQDVMRFDVTSESGTGLVENMRLPDGGMAGTATTGCFVGPLSVGTLTFKDCHIAGFPDNGLYASPALGPVHVVGGTYHNNAVANVRVSGNSVVRGVHVRCDSSPKGFTNMRGIRIRHGGGALVEDCVVELLDVNGSDGAITVESMVESATIRNVVLRVDADDVDGLRIKSPVRAARAADAPRITCSNVRITGSAARRAAVRVADRDDCTFEKFCVSQTGTGRNGIHLINANASVRHATIDVPGTPLLLEGGSVQTEDVVTNPLPGQSGGGPCGESSDESGGASPPAG